MPDGFTVDTREFNRAMDEYLAVSRKDRATVANAKLRDWMYKSFRETPKAERAEIREVIDSPKFISWWLTQTFGKGGWGRDDWKEAKKRLRRRLQAISYLRSGFSKAANKLPSGTEPRPGKQINPPGGKALVGKFKGSSKARVKRAGAGERNFSEADVSWSTRADSLKPQLLVNSALQAGRRNMVRDTQRYIERKLAKIGRKVSV